ncbi:MAG: dihydroxyacetone kinase subunit DhaK [Defluviitaleaceae bacterium]|nr:dihydroxyacetone kinase subunit DhaK [Defluviitaleaceae bacterium]
MKKIINNPQDIVPEMLNGIIAAHPQLDFDPKYKFLFKRKKEPNKVTLISGGGSGHEPIHGGFIGTGLLDCAVCGEVFASPSQIQVYQAIKATAGTKGVLLIIKNYSGDIMNFKNAAEMAKEDGIEVDYMVVDDDIAVEDSLYTVGKRGVAGTMFVHKIAGAAAAAGKSLAEVKAIAQKANENTVSIGFALTSCTIPAKGSPIFELGEDEIEYGVGIHGEPGIRREKTKTANELAKAAVEGLVKDAKLKKGDKIALLVNGFGATPLMELYLLNNAVTKELDQLGIEPQRTIVGSYMTSLDMAGGSVTFLKLEPELLGYLSDSAVSPAIVVDNPQDNTPYSPKYHSQAQGNYNVESDGAWNKISNEQFSLQNIIYTVDFLAQEIIKNESKFNDLDSAAGDGDFGTSVSKGFRQLKNEWSQLTANSKDIGEFLNGCSLIIMENCGGASGPIWGSAFRGAGKYTAGKTQLSVSEFAEMLQQAVSAIQTTGERSFGRGAVVGDKTLIDALVPCVEAWKKAAESSATFKDALDQGAKAAVDGAKATEKIVARLGRAGNVGERSLGSPDAGATGLGILFTAIANELK